MRTPTQAQAPNTLDSIMQSIGEMIEKADPEKIRIITEQMQTIIPAEGAEVMLQTGGNDQDKRITLTFFVSQVKASDSPMTLLQLLQRLLEITPTQEVNHLANVLRFLEGMTGQLYDWNYVAPYFSEGAQSHTCYFFIYKR